MSKLIVKKQDEIITLLDEKEIKQDIQYTKICYMFFRDDKLILSDNSDVSNITNMNPLKDDDIIMILDYNISNYSGPLYYADGTTIIEFNFNYIGSVSGGQSIGLMWNDEGSWKAASLTGSVSTNNVYTPYQLSNLNIEAGTPQNIINNRINRKFGAMDTIEAVVTYTDNTTETIKFIIEK